MDSPGLYSDDVLVSSVAELVGMSLQASFVEVFTTQDRALRRLGAGLG